MFSPESYWELQLTERLQTPHGIAFVERALKKAKADMRKAIQVLPEAPKCLLCDDTGSMSDGTACPHLTHSAGDKP
jgi:hypothetical protein